MNVEQFADFMKVQRSTHTAQVQQIEGQTRQLKENAERNGAEAQVKRITRCDGSTTKSLRHWFRDIDLSIPYTDRTVYVASQTSEGPLRLELERYLANLNDRKTATWPDVMQHLTTTFLSKHEADRLRDEVEKIQQGAYETASFYGRRFREAADIGYPTNGRNVDQQRAMLGAYLRGLRDRRLVERLVREGRPKDFLEAQEQMAQYEGDEYRLHRALNGTAPEESQEEPMEVGALMPRPVRYTEVHPRWTTHLCGLRQARAYQEESLGKKPTGNDRGGR